MAKKILYVEDDVDTQNLVKMILEKEGYLVEVVCDGRECLSKLSKEKPDLVLLDLMLPDMSGWDVFDKITTTRGYPPVKIAFLSAIPAPQERLIKLRSYSVSDYIMKPFDNEDLVRRIAGILD